MKFALPRKLAALATLSLATLTPLSSASAQSLFSEQTLPQSNFVAVASPFSRGHTLIVMEQIAGKQNCWNEIGSSPIAIDPLWETFDFTNSCRRYRDSNGYSIRIDGQDYGLDYLLNIVPRGNELVLIGQPRVGVQGSEILIARTQGYTDGTLKLQLEPGWQFTRRAYDGKGLGHIYFSRIQGTAGGGGSNNGGGGSTVFGDIATDIYRSEIEQAVQIGFIAGFPEDNTFRPLASLTREQLVSIVYEAVNSLNDINLPPATAPTTSPFPDVPANRWSAAKIKWARDNEIVTGYLTGTFRPTQNVTRAELIAVMKKAAQFVKTQRGQAPTLTMTQNARTFSDTSAHWANQTIQEMSAYCGVATPVNETGTRFEPDSASRRNYAAAAMLRMLNCAK
ncbi:MAG: DUF3747 domain-containing protein [Jaaginema sp. PMC 1079.18]|nr:DUF3747 domain-containing protein [Jaaginema sp. PMC 1080.18]MEC4852775.1 DUF3747 domain-containing protein [Jaaginema sp. PMC 1079.18]MEC4867419.1 DUF3747 domain-containing protein [Jaaginema sp. PMC 1078.18]